MKISYRQCEYCQKFFESIPGSEVQYCCSSHRKRGKASKLSEVGKKIDMSVVRNARTTESIAKQAAAIKSTLTRRKAGHQAWQSRIKNGTT